MRSYDYFRPQSLEEALRLKKSIPDSRFLSGGTDLLVQIKNRKICPPVLISLRSIPELSSIDINGHARIGALVTISEVIEHPTLGLSYPVLKEAAKSLGSTQIRNVATLGGNLCNCSPCADMALPLLVLEAKVRLQTTETSRDIPLTEFFTGPGESCLASDEIMTDILLSPPQKSAKTIFLKKGRVKMDLAIASVAALLIMEKDKCCKARIAAGSVAPVPLRLFEIEALLEKDNISKKVADKAQQLAANTISPITDIRATDEYRRHIVGIYMERAIKKLLGWS